MVKRVGGEEREHTVPQRISLLGETAVRLRVSLDEANSELQSIQHDTFQIGLAKSWLPDESGRVKAQGVCWLFCWAKTGMKSPKTAYRAKEAFNKILSVSYEDFDERVPHDWARTARYKKENMEKELAGLLRGVNT